jgi:transposase
MEIQTEIVDDTPFIIASFKQTPFAEMFNKHFPKHGNWQGLDAGNLLMVYCTHILSRSNHKLSHVEGWAEGLINTLRICLDSPNLVSKDFTDDRLGDLLDKIWGKKGKKDDSKWYNFESELNGQLIEVHSLSSKEKNFETIRIDALNVQSYREESELFKIGYAKQHRRGLPQMKIMVAMLDSLRIPLCSVIVPGNAADDKHYIPAIEQLLLQLDEGQLFVADCKLGSRENRAFIVSKNQHYLSPLSKTQCSDEEIEYYLSQIASEANWQELRDDDGELKAKAYELKVTMTSLEGDLTWEERRIICYSSSYVESQQKNLGKRILATQTELNNVFTPIKGKKIPKSLESTQKTVAAILQKNKVVGLFHIEIQEHKTQKEMKKYKNRAAGVYETISYSLDVKLDEENVEKHRKLLGIKVYATSAPAEKLSTLDAVQSYRDEYRIEHKFNELLNKITALFPIYLQKENRIKALTRVVLLALKFSSVIQYKVRQELEEKGENVKGLYKGNKNRATNKPTIKMLLESFQKITLSIVKIDNQYIAKLSNFKPIQKKILELMGLNIEVYTRLEQIFFVNEKIVET